jgi:Ca2+-binding EF-hand superfamily protein
MQAQGLRDALKVFDFDNDGKISQEEFKYFMEEFGEPENDLKIVDLCKLLDEQGFIKIDKLVNVLTH